MMQQVPENITSIQSPGGTFALAWDAIEGTEIQQWQFLRCDYPISSRNAAGMLSGGMDLMLSRWELHPTVTEVEEDTGVEGKHYCALAIDGDGALHFPEVFEIDPAPLDSTRLSDLPVHKGWIKGVKGGKDRYKNVF